MNKLIGYQPNKGYLDSNNPPKGGSSISGLPNTCMGDNKQSELLEKIKTYQKDYLRSQNIKEEGIENIRIMFKNIVEGLIMAYKIIFDDIVNDSVLLTSAILQAESEVLKEKEWRLNEQK
jgi:hypothetical protein